MKACKNLKVGDAVTLDGSHAKVTGIIISPWRIDGWWEIFTARGQVIHWPDSQMKVVENA